MRALLRIMSAGIACLAVLFTISCDPTAAPPAADESMDDGPIAANIMASLGEPLPGATAAQLATFERGKAVSLKRFDLADGLGPAFNVTFCGACHERPVFGGSAGLYRNFFLSGRLTSDGAFIEGESAGTSGGVIRVYNFGGDQPARPAIPEETTIFAQRNPIPMFGVGLIAELDGATILANADEDDADGDGISGRANFDRGFVGRFGRKSQTVSIEGFIRGPFFNHLGVTSDPLTDEDRANLPVDSALAKRRFVVDPATVKGTLSSQAAAPDAPNFDDDGVADPELAADDLFDLVSFVMLLAAPEFEDPTAESNTGRLLFHEAGCSGCHLPRIEGPRGLLPLYSDLLLHDMGEELADGIVQGLASGSEFRTQPLWGLASVGPYLHDGRAETVDDAILAHGGESQASRNAYAAFSASEKSSVIEFLMTLGGRPQFTAGLIAPDEPIAEVGTFGGPRRALITTEKNRFLRGRELFDRDIGHATGVGSPRFNGDSCRACHFDPVIGGSGPRDVNVMRHGLLNAADQFTPPAVGTILHKQTIDLAQAVVPQDGVMVFEHRQSPPLFGLGLIEAISDETIASLADADDSVDGDGITGRMAITDDGRVGRFGWKAQVPSIAEFVRDAMAAEIGMTVEPQAGLTFGTIDDNDGVDDPELSATDAEDLAFFIRMLAAPPRQQAFDEAMVASGEALFDEVGCTKCHVPSLDSSLGPVELYSDLLLHEILPPLARGIEDGSASTREFRTAPLWGLNQSAPYFHSGEADTVDEAIRLHDGEGATVRAAYEALDEDSRAAILAFLATL